MSTPCSALDALARTHLLEHGTTDGRWRMHDLVRVYAQEQGDSGSDREAALDRMLDTYLATAYAADMYLRDQPEDEGGEFGSRREALSWFEAEHSNLRAASALACQLRRYTTAMRLASSLARFLSWTSRFEEDVAVGRLGVAAARRLGAPRAEAVALNNFGVALRGHRRFEEAIEAHRRAAAIYAAGERP
jgi:hypothetical protein